MADRLQPGQSIERDTGNDRITSANGVYTLVMQDDGNLVLYRSGGHALWASNTSGTDGKRATMQGDGNFVLYRPNNQPLWASNTSGKPGCFVVAQNDGNLVVYQPNAPVWASNTVQH
jgi:hypothetical protein